MGEEVNATMWIIPHPSTDPLPMYAISLQGSNREYLDDLDRMFCAAPTSTANIKGVVPRAAVTGLKKPVNNRTWKRETRVGRLGKEMARASNRYLAGSCHSPSKMMREKKVTPVIRRVMGVMRAAVPQPNFWKIVRPSNIIINVTALDKIIISKAKATTLEDQPCSKWRSWFVVRRHLPRGSREVPHKGRIGIGIREGLLQLALPGHLHDVDRHT